MQTFSYEFECPCGRVLHQVIVAETYEAAQIIRWQDVIQHVWGEALVNEELFLLLYIPGTPLR
jgi:hypothetical protein